MGHKVEDKVTHLIQQRTGQVRVAGENVALLLDLMEDTGNFKQTEFLWKNCEKNVFKCKGSN